jgi:hypothetical protein
MPYYQADCGSLEIYMRDSRTLLVVFATSRDRQEINTKLSMLHGGGPRTPEPVSAGGFRTPLIRSVGSKALNGFREEIWTAQRRWQAREISNVSLAPSAYIRSEVEFYSSPTSA